MPARGATMPALPSLGVLQYLLKIVIAEIFLKLCHFEVNLLYHPLKKFRVRQWLHFFLCRFSILNGKEKKTFVLTLVVNDFAALSPSGVPLILGTIIH